MSWVQYGKEPLTCTVGNEDGFNQGDLKGYGQDQHADFFFKFDMEVDGTSSGTVTGMTEAQALTYLKTALSVDMRFDLDPKNSRGGARAQDPANVFHPLQALPFDDLRLMNVRLLEKDMALLTDTTTGLRRSYTAGNFTIAFTMYGSLGKVAFLGNWAKVFGVGPHQLELMRLKVRAVSDGLKAFNSALTTTGVRCSVKAFRLPTKGNRACLPPLRRRYQPGDDKRQVQTHGGTVPLEVIDTNAKLSLTELTSLTVEVGGVLLTDRDLPSEIRDAYTINEDVAAPESNIANYATEIYVLPDSGLNELRGGPVVATQEQYEVAWDASATLLAALDEQSVKRFIQAIASQGLKNGGEFHFVNAAVVEGLEEGVRAGILPALGLAYFDTSAPEAQKYPGMRCDANGKLTVYIPPDDLVKAAREYQQAMAETSAANPLGNVAKMDAALNTVGRGIPGYVEDEVLGFPSSTKAAGGAETGVYLTVRGEVRKLLGLK